MSVNTQPQAHEVQENQINESQIEKSQTQESQIDESQIASYGGWQEQGTLGISQQSSRTPKTSEPLPLLDEDDSVNPQHILQERPWWMHPFPRMVVAGSAVMGVLYVLFSMFGLWGSSSQPVPTLSADASNIEQEVADRLKQLQTDNENLRRDQIMGQPLPAASSSTQQPKTTPNTVTPQKPKVVYVRTSTPRRTYVPPRVPPRRDYNTSPRPVTPVISRPVTPTIAKPTPVNVEPKLDPTGQWMAVANIGSYGSISYDSKAIGSQPNDADETTSYQIDTQTTNPTQNTGWQISGGLGEPPIKAIGVLAQAGTNRQPSIPIAQRQVQETYSPQFQENQAVNYSSKTLIVGTKAKAKLQTPIAWSGDLQATPDQNFLIQLNEPLLSSDRSIAIPEGAYLVARIATATNTGLLQMSAVAVLSAQNNRTTERALPPQAILILGKGGKPLQAKSNRKGSSGSDLGMVLLSGVGSAASVANRATSQSVFSSGGNFSSTTTNNDPNYVAGFGQGAAQAIVQQMQERKQRLRQSNQSQPQVFTLDQDTTVQVFVNSSVQL